MKKESQKESSLTLIDLVDSIVHNDSCFNETKSEQFQKLKGEYVFELSKRIHLSKPATALFSNVIYNSIRGNYLNKSEAFSILQFERTFLIKSSVNELFKAEYVKYFRESHRRPDIKLFVPDEIEEKVINNIIPKPKIKTAPTRKEMIRFSPMENHLDYVVMLKSKVIGTVYYSIVDEFIYTAVIGSKIIGQHDDLGELQKMVNEYLAENKLVVLSQE